MQIVIVIGELEDIHGASQACHATDLSVDRVKDVLVIHFAFLPLVTARIISLTVFTKCQYLQRCYLGSSVITQMLLLGHVASSIGH